MKLQLPPYVISAMNAMMALGFSWERTKPVLKDLLRAFDNNWEHIEADNYRVLADAILDSLEPRDGHLKKKRHNGDVKSKDDDLKRSKFTGISDAQIVKQDGQDSQFSEHRKIISAHSSSMFELNDIGLIHESSGNAVTHNQNLPIVKWSLVEKGSTSSSRTDGKEDRLVHQVLDTSLKKSKSMSLVIKEPAANITGYQELPSLYNLSEGSCPSQKIVPAQNAVKKSRKEGSLNQNVRYNSVIADTNVQNSSSINIELASSTLGEMRLMAHYNPARPCPDFHMPSLEALCKVAGDRYLKSYKFFDPHICLLSLLTKVCDCAVELGFKYPKELGNIDMLVSATRDDSRSPRASENNGMIVFHQPEHSSSTMTDIVCKADICRGEENVKISLATSPGVNRYPILFHYIPRNISYQHAYVNISLARIGDEDCCATCSGDCLAAPIPCPCAKETGGDYAYTKGGLLKEKFLDAIISMKNNLLRENLFFCNVCPIEIFKNEFRPEPCKGHLIRKFVKECWNKCGCDRICGNRLVQRGITCNLQVFWTSKRKGWGLRTLEKLPKGTFICEYVGEILTNTELYQRHLHVTGKMRDTYPVLLDADWGSEQILKDEEALCLDATFYGNVARFINHRCADANVLEVPVEIETPDHHYYHLAFFTVREVDAFEEITWDYGIDFADHTHPIKAFSCHCGSKLCRDTPQIRRERAMALR